jgi:hypothetical protein
MMFDVDLYIWFFIIIILLFILLAFYIWNVNDNYIVLRRYIDSHVNDRIAKSEGHIFSVISTSNANFEQKIAFIQDNYYKKPGNAKGFKYAPGKRPGPTPKTVAKKEREPLSWPSPREIIDNFKKNSKKKVK